MTLTQRINDRRQTDLTPLREQRVAERRQPTWIKRMQDGELRAKDLSGKVAA
jgi:hypothetical protein